MLLFQEQRRLRYAARQRRNSPARPRGRPRLQPAAYKSELSRLKPLELGRMDQICNDCNAKHWKAELPMACTSNNKYWVSCCKSGAVKVELLKDPPTCLKDLYDDNGPRGKKFKQNIRRYNSVFAFTSVGCATPNRQDPNMPFQIQGKMHHTQGPLTTRDPSKSQYAQLYIYDPESAANIRISNNDNELDTSIVTELSFMLHSINPFVKLYKTAYPGSRIF